MWNFLVEIDGVQYPVRIEAGVMTLPSMSLPLQRAALNYAQNHGYPVERIEVGPCAVIMPPMPPAPPAVDPEPEGIVCLTCHRLTTEATLADGGDKTGPYCPDCGQGENPVGVTNTADDDEGEA